MVTISLHFEIADSDVYGGEGTTGYASTDSDFKLESLSKMDFCKFVEEQRKAVASMCSVGTDKVKLITKSDLEEKDT